MAIRGKLMMTGALFMALAWALGPLGAQETPAPAGHWEGAILVPTGELEINVDLMVEEGAWSGDVSIPAQATEDFALSEVMVDGNKVSFLMAGVPGDPTFEGTLSEDGLTIKGTFSQAGATLEFRLTKSG